MPTLGERYAHALVTGAGSGLGKAFTEALILEGVRIWGTSRHPESLPAYARFTPVGLDLESQENVAGWFEALDELAGGFDLVINNAGFAEFGALEGMAAQAVDDQLRVLLIAPMQISGAAFASMRRRGRGCLVNVSSVASELWIPYLSVYNASKAGLSAFSQSLMLEAPLSEPWIVDFRAGDHRTAFNQRMRRSPAEDDRAAAVWMRLEALMETAPDPTQAAADLLRALRSFRHRTCYSGTFFQTRIAPLAFRLFPNSLKRGFLGRYFHIS